MKANKTMREMMVAASLFAVSACGAVEAVDTAEFPPDETMDMGSGSDEEPSVLEIESVEFVDDGLRWWSSSSGPMLSGSYEGGPDAVVQVKAGAGASALATVTGSRWNVQLPSGTIMDTDTLITVTLTDPARGVVSLEQVFALDSTAPVIGLGASKLRDERGDVIDFSTGVPVHAHQGAEIDLGVGGCPKVYKYSYLMDTHAPVHGSELAPNPIAWNITLQDARLEVAEFLVRNDVGTVLRDWKPLVGTGASYPLTLYRDGDSGLGELAMKPGKYTIDVRARDWGGLESTASYCIDFQPLAAPLQFMPATIPSDADALKSRTLVANSPISRVTKPGTGGAIVEQKLTQYSSEPVALQLGAGPLTGTFRIEYHQGWVESSRTKILIPCGSMNCDALSAPTAHSLSGALSIYTTTVELIDSSSGHVLDTASPGIYVIPGRSAGAQPAEYRVRIRLSGVTHYGHSSAFAYDERALENLSYTGSAPTQTTTACARVDIFGNCTARATYQYLRGTNTIGLTVQPVSVLLAVAASQAGVFTAPAHVLATSFVSPALVWDGGDENTL